MPTPKSLLIGDEHFSYLLHVKIASRAKRAVKFWPVFGEFEYLGEFQVGQLSYVEDEEGKGNWFMMLENLDFIILMMTILPDYCTLQKTNERNHKSLQSLQKGV